jgi:type VII secretion integral membrane protein EccD
MLRVSVHAGDAVTDLALPASVPVATLIPSIVDILDITDGAGELEAQRYQLSGAGAAPLITSVTLAQNNIRDGAVLVLTQAPTAPPVPRYDDVAEAVSATLGAASRPWTRSRRRQAARLTGALAAGCLTGIGALALIRHAVKTGATGMTVGVAVLAGVAALLAAALAHRTYKDAIAGLALSVIATTFAAVAGFLAVPGAPGLPNIVLAASAAAVTTVSAARVSGCGVLTLTALSCVATITAAAALVGVITAAPVPAIGSVAALISVGLLGAAPRASIVLAGLSPQLPPAPDLERKAIRAASWLAGLRAGFASAIAVGSVVTVLAGAPRPGCIAFGVLVGALLLLRARSDDGIGTRAVAACGIVITATTFGTVTLRIPMHGVWTVAMTASLAAAAIYLGFVAPAVALSPALGRSVEALECAALVAMVPMTCWVCDLYGAVRGLTFT